MPISVAFASANYAQRNAVLACPSTAGPSGDPTRSAGSSTRSKTTGLDRTTNDPRYGAAAKGNFVPSTETQLRRFTGDIPSQQALLFQLAMIAGNEPDSSLLEIRWRRPTGMGQTFVGVRELHRAATAIRHRAQLTDVYVGCAPRVRENGSTDAIERVWVLWTDCDSETSVAALRRFRPLPSMVNGSGSDGRLHAWWALHEPLGPEQAKRSNRRLALALGSDRAATDGARVMRPSGSLNYKHEPPRSVECVRLELDAFTVGEIVGGLGDDAAYRPNPRPRHRSAPRRLGNALDGLVRHVQGAIPGDEAGRGRNCSLNWAAFRAGEHVAAGRLAEDEAEGALLQAALDMGLPEHEAARTIASGLSAGQMEAA